MYNLLVTAKRGAWDEEEPYEFYKNRFLEYTVESISEVFKSLDADLIETLKSYPCIFAYEGDDKELHIGRLTSITEEETKLSIEFEINKGIRPIPFADIEPIAERLDIREWEINRTHWAVKEKDLYRCLSDAKLLDSTLRQEWGEEKELPEKKFNAHRVTSVQQFIEEVLSPKEEDDQEVFYRGHSNKNKYKLEPSLFRKDDDGNYLYLENEHILYRELLVSNSADFQSDECTLDKLVRMQHYSLPTRLLDITSNPLIALYFACKSALDEDGEVITFSIPRKEVKYFDSDVASCISNLARLPKGEGDKICFDKEPFNEQASVKRLIDFIKEEKPYFESKIIPGDLGKIICVKGKQSNDRISSQSGAFLLYGYDAVMNEDGAFDIVVTRITVADKEKILKELDLLNINESTVFPYIENSAKYVAEKYKFSKARAGVNKRKRH